MGSVYFYFYENELLYVGSTFDMKRRHNEHKRKYKYVSIPFYTSIKENGLTLDDLELEEVITEITGKPKKNNTTKITKIKYQKDENNIEITTRIKYQQKINNIELKRNWL